MESVFLGIIIVAACVLAVRFPKLLRSKTPPATVTAQIVSRRGNLPGNTYSGFRGQAMEYLIIFQIGEEQLELHTTASQYTRLMEGMHGTLTYTDQTLISFEPSA